VRSTRHSLEKKQSSTAPQTRTTGRFACKFASKHSRQTPHHKTVAITLSQNCRHHNLPNYTICPPVYVPGIDTPYQSNRHSDES